MRKLSTAHCTLSTGTALPGTSLPGDRTRTQRSGTCFPYTRMRMELDHIVYENENDYAITEAKPEQALRDPRHHGSKTRAGAQGSRAATAVCSLPRLVPA
jgi:hypothetical protein